jgi:hypothetical protein
MAMESLSSGISSEPSIDGQAAIVTGCSAISRHIKKRIVWAGISGRSAADGAEDLWPTPDSGAAKLHDSPTHESGLYNRQEFEKALRDQDEWEAGLAD